MRLLAEICMLIAIGVLAYVAAIKNVDRGPGYDDELRNMVAQVQPGDWKRALNAYGYCAGELKPYGDSERSTFLGSCTGPNLLLLITIIESGDPVKIKEELELRNDFDFTRHLPHMKQFARTMIQQRCRRNNPPTSCFNKDMMNWFEE